MSSKSTSTPNITKKRVLKHPTKCQPCWNMESRGYRSESKYWDDFFKKREKLIIYELVYKGRIVNDPV